MSTVAPTAAALVLQGRKPARFMKHHIAISRGALLPSLNCSNFGWMMQNWVGWWTWACSSLGCMLLDIVRPKRALPRSSTVDFGSF